MKNICSILITATAFLTLFGCAQNSTPNSSSQKDEKSELQQGSFWVKHSGNRLRIINDGNLNATVSLDTLLAKPNLFAIGPIEGLKGEITVYDGTVSIATIENDLPKFSASAKDVGAIFLAYGSCTNWQKITIDKDLFGLDEIEHFVKTQLQRSNFGTETPIFFKIEGSVDSLGYHIIYKQDEAPHNKAEHQKAKQRFNVKGETVNLLGFWADSTGEGVYTHLGRRTHLHFLTKDDRSSGHIDKIALKKGSILFLPLVN